MNVSKIIAIARKHLSTNHTMDSSARACLKDAIESMDIRQDFKAAKMWALKSIAYSVGYFHPDYKRCEK